MSHDHGRTCLCVKTHRPKVVELDRHHVIPIYLGGLDTESNVVWICAQTHRATHELLRLYLKLNEAPSQDVVDDFPRMARALALRGWQEYIARDAP